MASNVNSNAATNTGFNYMRFLKGNTYIPAISAAVVLLILGQILSHGFLSMNNLSSILLTSAILTLAAMGQTIVIISGNSGLDLSLGSVMSMTALLGPMVRLGSEGVSFAAMIVVSLALGAFVGFCNGAGTRYLHLPPLVMTLIMASVVDGFTLFITKGQPAVNISNTLQSVCNNLVGPIRVLTALVLIILILVEVFLLRRSKYGRSLYLVGNNPHAATLSGLNVNRTIILAYTINGIVAGLAGLFLVAYAGSAQMQMASEYTMLSIAAVVIGGTKLTGGKGSLVGTAIGAVVLVVLANILEALNMPAGLRTLIEGLILICILLSNRGTKKLRQ
jgi:ribose transport system permease protein